MGIWLPDVARFTGRRIGGQPQDRRRADLPPRLTGHTTETPAGTAEAVAKNLAWPYTMIVDPARRQILQLLPLDSTAYSLRGTHAATGAKIETNHLGKMHPQIALVGYAKDMDDLSVADLDWLADNVFGPVMELCGIPNVWEPTHGEGEGVVLASTRSPIRLTRTECEAYSGVLWHQHWYGQDHWDGGAINVEHLQKRISTAGKPMTDPRATFDKFSNNTFNGWAIDPDDTDHPVQIVAYTHDDGQAAKIVGTTTTDVPRKDVQVHFQKNEKLIVGDRQGFSLHVADLEGVHKVALYAVNVAGTPGANVRFTGIEEHTFTRDGKPPPKPAPTEQTPDAVEAKRHLREAAKAIASAAKSIAAAVGLL